MPRTAVACAALTIAVGCTSSPPRGAAQAKTKTATPAATTTAPGTTLPAESGPSTTTGPSTPGQSEPGQTTPAQASPTPAVTGETVPTPTIPVSSPADAAPFLAQRDQSGDVAAYAAALDALQPICVEDRLQIAALGDFGRENLEKNGTYGETRLTVLQHLRGFIPETTGKVNCRERLLQYIVIRTTG